MIAKENTLAETLRTLGYTYRACTRPGKNEILRDNSVVFCGTAHETWSWLRERGEVR